MTAWLALIAFLAGDPEFLKGQLHLHSNRSGDSDTPPADVVRWYASRGYDFIVFTDHNRITTLPSTPSMLVIPGVELTQNSSSCTPPPPPGLRCLLHVNALFVSPSAGGIPWGASNGTSRDAIYRRALDATGRMNGLAQLNHPNFYYGADGPLVARLAGEGLALLEIANRSWDSNDVPDDQRRPSTEAIWDAALTAGANVYGTATDDAHHYFDASVAGVRGEKVFPGDLGFVMVRAAKNPPAIRAALARGDFYASTGVFLKRIERIADRLEIEIDDRSPGPHHFDFIGAGGKTLASAEGRRASFALAAARGGYVRALIVDRAGRRAWVQPTRVRPP